MLVTKYGITCTSDGKRNELQQVWVRHEHEIQMILMELTTNEIKRYTYITYILLDINYTDVRTSHVHTWECIRVSAEATRTRWLLEAMLE